MIHGILDKAEMLSRQPQIGLGTSQSLTERFEKYSTATIGFHILCEHPSGLRYSESSTGRWILNAACGDNAGFFTRNFTGFDVSTPRCFRWVRKYLDSAQLVNACGA